MREAEANSKARERFSIFVFQCRKLHGYGVAPERAEILTDLKNDATHCGWHIGFARFYKGRQNLGDMAREPATQFYFDALTFGRFQPFICHDRDLRRDGICTRNQHGDGFIPPEDARRIVQGKGRIRFGAHGINALGNDGP